MKKLLFMLVALMATVTAFAQDNLALNKEAKATSGFASNAVDGNTGTRWESAQEDNQTWQVDLGTAQEFNTIQIVWEGAYTKTYTIEAGDNVDGDGWLTDGTVIASGVNTEMPNTQTIKLAAPVTARYIKYNAIDRGTQWGNSFWEFRVINITEASKVTTFSVKPEKDYTTLNSPITITPTIIDQFGQNMEAEVSYEISPATGATVTDNKFTATEAGLYTITAKAGDVTAAPVTIYAINGEKINITTDMVSLLNGDCTENGMASAFDNNEGSVWVYREYPGTQVYDAGFIVDLGAYYDIDFVRMVQEGACSGDYTLYTSVDGSNYNSVFHKTVGGYAWQYDNAVLTENNEGIRYLKFHSTKAADGNTWGVKMAEFSVYGTKDSDIVDDDMPELDDPTIKDVAAESATIVLKATDATATTLTYKITLGDKQFSTTGNSGEEIEFTLSGLSQNTAYTAVVTVTDGINTTDSKSVNFTTTEIVPFDYDDDCNLWKTATKTIGWFYAPGWAETTGPEVTETDGVYTFTLPQATWERWQAQLSITSDIATNNENNYDFSATIRVSKPVTVAFQLGTGYEYATKDIALKADEDYVIRLENFAGLNLNNIKFFVDFGGNQADTEVTISNIVFKESDCDENAEITAIDIKNRNEIPSEIYVEEGGQITIIDQDGNDVTPGFITFTSSDDTKITVDAQGNVEAIAATEPGSTVTITAALTSNPDITTEISFTIVEDLLHVDYVGEDGIVVLAGSWNMDLFKNIDAEQKATAYDFTKVKNIPDATNNNESTKNPNAFFISPVAGKFRKNEVVRKDADGYQGYNIQIIDFFGDTEDHSVNTHIAPITVTDPVFLRIFNTTGIYATVVLPWIGKIQNNVRFYELTNANTADGVTTLVFSEAGVTAAPEAGKPYVVYVDQSAGADLVMIGGGEQTITWNNNNSGAGSDIVFRGTFEKVAKADNQYTLNGTMAEPEFGKNMFDIPAFRGYIQKENGINGSAKFEVFFSDATGIHRATTDQLNAVFNIYSIDGKVIQRNADSMINLKKGVYIINGKKTVVK